MKESNILLTSLGNLGNRLSHEYFYFGENGTIRYCDGISVGESGAKYIMSHNTMDEIVVIGSGTTYNPGEEGMRIPLKNYSGYRANNIDSLSEYGFYLYRLLQFQRGIDLEAIDVLEQIDSARRNEIVSSYEDFCAEYLRENPGCTKDHMFHYLSQDAEMAHNMYSRLPNLSRHEVRWLKRYIYTALPSELRLTSLDVNSDLKISFIPSDRADRGEGAKFAAGDNIIRILQFLYKSDDVKINLYVDLQGLEASAGYSILAIISMLSNDANSNFEIKEIITSHYLKDGFANPIDNNEMSRYEINRLISGMDAFIKYGKVSIIENYWQNTGIKNEHIDRLVNAMRWMDDGISLCNIEDLEYGISLLKKVFREPFMGELPEFESNVFQVLERGIRMDYGELLNNDEFNCLALVKWAFRKKFYQQCLTIIESKMPNELVARGILYYMNNDEDKELFFKNASVEYWAKPSYLRYAFNEISHYYIKFHGRSFSRTIKTDNKNNTYLECRIRSLDDNSILTAPAFSIIDDHREELEALLSSYYNLGEVRNSINHALPKEGDENTESNDRMELVINTITGFIANYEAVLRIIEEKGLQDFRAKTVEFEEFKKYAEEHMRESRRSGGGRGGYRGNRGYRGGQGGYRGGHGGYHGNNNIQIPSPKLNPGEKLVVSVEVVKEEDTNSGDS
ncbi:hypothetical protein SAMN02910456_00501 [Ruminococcaceae bacterium YRB3002]|nr:hypothetical protein SAMN02910456_00501 [Ruminococcaceae bacterium YRB3002]